MAKVLHLQGQFCGYDKFGRALIAPPDDDELKSIKKVNNLGKGQPDKKLPVTRDGFKINVPKDSASSLEKYLGGPVDLYVTVKEYNLRDKETRNKVQGFSLCLKKVEDMNHAHSDIRDNMSSE